jgi:hypothetical protein
MYRMYYAINLIQLPGPTLIYLNSMLVHIIIIIRHLPSYMYTLPQAAGV